MPPAPPAAGQGPAQGGSAAAAATNGTTDADAAADQQRANGGTADADTPSPFVRLSQDHWGRARQAVQNNVGLSQAFNTLRDRKSPKDVILPEQLKTVKVLGQGAFATVEQAMYTPKGGGKPYTVAVKRLKMELFRNQEDLDLFVQEVELMRKLSHRNIVEFIGAGEVKPGEVPGWFACEFVVQEYMAGGTLKQLVTRDMLGNGRQCYSNKDALDICVQMARGLRYLHKVRPMVIHRDLKLENVLLKSAEKVDGQFEVKLADFGLSRTVQVKQQAVLNLHKAHSTILSARSSTTATTRDSDKMPSIPLDTLEEEWTLRAKTSFVATHPPRTISLPALSQDLGPTGSFMQAGDAGRGSQVFDLTGRTGSLMYMAPEVFREEPYSEKADVFSFAIMTYEVLQRYIMLSAVAVTGTYSELEAYCARMAAGYRPPLHAQWPPRLSKLIQDCWAQDPDARPTMDEVVTRLEAIQVSGDMAALDAEQRGCCAIC